MQRRVRRQTSEDGFTLIETVIALAIATIMFAALGAVSLAGLHSVVLSRENQQAADVLNRAIEHARSIPFGNLTMQTGDLSVGDAGTITGTPPAYLVPGGVGSENVDAKAVGDIAPHVSIESPDGKMKFTLKRYVTVPSSATFDLSGFPSVRRFTAVVSWSSYGRSHTRRSSTLITDTRRGLPLPNYVFQALAPTSQTKNPDTDVAYTFTVRNLGARDAFNISASSGTWNFFADTNNNGVLDPDNDPATTTDDQPLSNWDAATGNTAPDTGELDPNQTFKFFARRHIGLSESGTTVVTFTTVSAAQPSATGATKTAGVTLSVQTGPVSSPPPTSGSGCPSPSGAVATGGTTITSFFLHNRPVGNTATTPSNALAREDCTVQTADHDYSTEDPGHSVGRIIRPGGTAGNVASNLASEWRYQVNQDTLVQGTAVIQFAFTCTSATGPTTSGSATFQLMVGTRSNDNGNLSGFSAISSATTPSLSCPASGWTTVSIPVGVSMTVPRNKWLAVRLVTSSTSSRVLVNYDSPNAVSLIALPVAP